VSKIYSLPKTEILRGYKVFENILKNSLIFQSEFITAYLNLNENQSESPVTVGFLVSKKKSKNLLTEID
jgi:RNase P protein component